MATYNFDYALQMLRQAIDFAEAEHDFTKARKWVNELAASHAADVSDLREQLEAVAKAEPIDKEAAELVEWLEEKEPIIYSGDVRTYISGGEVMERKV